MKHISKNSRKPLVSPNKLPLKVALYTRGFDESYRAVPYEYDGKNYIWNENYEVFECHALLKRWAKQNGYKLWKA